MKNGYYKLLSVILCTFAIACFSACSNNVPDTPEASATPTQTVVPTVSSTAVPTEPAAPTAVPAEPTATPTPELATDYLLSVDTADTYDISDILYGLFFEDINFAVDGGIYAEMIKNRSFEYGTMATNRNMHGWYTVNQASPSIVLEAEDCLNANNPTYLTLTNSQSDLAGITNTGFLDGMSLTENALYKFSIYAKSKDYTGDIIIRLTNSSGKTIYGETKISGITNEWHKYSAELTSNATTGAAVRLQVLISKGSVDIDMVSLFPADTYKGRENGIRKDIGEYLEALNPGFLRFPGGCVVEGESLDNAYSWKDSIGNGMTFDINGETTYGDVAVRPLGEDIWGAEKTASAHPYYMTYGIGFYEYFLLCEDLDCEPVPILNAGLSCLIQGVKTTGVAADTLAITSDEFKQYVQDALDLVEFCRGGADTYWGNIRIQMGHEEPFKLTYLGIGNEQWTDAYFLRYEQFKKAFEEATAANPELYGGIELIVANGPVSSDKFAWNKIRIKGADYAGLVDEHYYQTPEWFLENTKRYDSYDRNSTAVFLGEYAAKSNTAKAALAEAAYMTGLERNGDIVKLAAYAPLFGNLTQTQWTPDLIWFNSTKVWGSPNYYVQKIFANNLADKNAASTLTGSVSNGAEEIKYSGKVGVGSWQTGAVFDDLLVVSNTTGETLYSDDFSSNSMSEYTKIAGTWEAKDGMLFQTNTGAPVNSITGDVVYVGDTNWTDYTLTVKATKTSGAEGFLIPIAVQDKNNFVHWNIGGWGNTVSCLEETIAGSKSGQISSTVKNFAVKTGQTYEIKIIVSGANIKCYIDNKLMVDYTKKSATGDSLYQVCGIDKNGDVIIKLVNVIGSEISITINLKDKNFNGKAELSLITARSANASNSYGNPENVAIEYSDIDVSNSFVYTAPQYSVSVIRIPAESIK